MATEKYADNSYNTFRESFFLVFQKVINNTSASRLYNMPALNLRSSWGTDPEPRSLTPRKTYVKKGSAFLRLNDLTHFEKKYMHLKI